MPHLVVRKAAYLQAVEVQAVTGTTVLMATHQHNFLKRNPARVLFCEDGQLRSIDRDTVLEKMQEGA